MNRINLRCDLVIEVIELLRQVRSGLNFESDRVLAESIDEVIEKLDQCVGVNDIGNGVAEFVLKVLGQGLAALPAIQKLIELMNGN